MEEPTLTESQKLWRKVQQCLVDEEFESAIQLCNSGDSFHRVRRMKYLHFKWNHRTSLENLA